MRLLKFRKISLLISCFCAGLLARAGEWEFAGAFGGALESKGNIVNNGNFPTVPYTIVDNHLEGGWYLGGVQVGYEALRLGKWGLWLQAHYSEAVNHPNLYHAGEFYTAGSTIRESYNGTESYKSYVLGIAMARRFSVGEFGISVGSRSHDLSVKGQRQMQVNGTSTFDQFATSYSTRDVLVTLSFSLAQDHKTYRTFQRISIGTGLGSSLPAVNPGPNDWHMSSAYLAQGLPNQEVLVHFGARL